MIRSADFLVLAESGVTAAGEAEWRSAVSRAYFAAHHRARQFLSDLGFQLPPGDQAHAYLWLRLANCGDPQVRLAGSDLNSLCRDRYQADHHLDITVTQPSALLQVQCAATIIRTLDAVAVPARAAIAEAIRNYERDVLHQVTWQA